MPRQGRHFTTPVPVPMAGMGYRERVAQVDDLDRSRLGLCADCLHARRVETSRGSRFCLCQRAAIDPTFPKYPQLPVVRCPGHENDAHETHEL